MDTLEVTGIKKIVWIDDDFAEESLDRESLQTEIISHTEAYLDADSFEELKAMYPDGAIDFDTPKEIFLDQLSSYLSQQNNDILSQIFEKIEGDNTELSDKDVDVISNFISDAKISLDKLSLASWRKESGKFNDVGSETLFLVDKEFTKEGESSDAGIEILKSLLQQYKSEAPPNFILFTHTCRSPNEEEDLRNYIYRSFKDSLGLDESFHFQVLSKSVAYDKASAQSRLFGCIRAIFVRKTFSEMAYRLRNEIVKSLDQVTENLISTNVYGLDKSIFGSSLLEGVSELELLQRIYSLSQRTAMTRVITSNSDVVQGLTKLRKLKQQSRGDTEVEQVDLSAFEALRLEEFWFNGEDINKTHSPIVCGDIFKVKKREFILLSQPCDTILREDGKRKTNMAVLVPIKKYSFETEEELQEKYIELSSKIFSFVFRETNIQKSFWCVSFNQAVSVSLDILDLSTFNEFGRVEFLLEQDMPELLHLEGQRNKFLRFRELANDRDNFPTSLCIDRGVYTKEPAIAGLEFKEESGWNSKITRIRRLEAIYSEHALGKYFTYKSRKAFEHDFTRH